MKKALIYFFAMIFPLYLNATVDIKVLEAYQKACDDGNLKKCIAAGKFLNQPVKNEDIFDFDKAMANYQKACDGGEYEACYFIAHAIMRNPDVKGVDMLKALDLNKKACDGDIASACWALGTMYMQGEGTQKDTVLAKKYNKRACDLDYTPSCSETDINTQRNTYNKPSDICLDTSIQNTVIKLYREELFMASVNKRRSLPLSHFHNLHLTSIRFNGVNTTSQTTYCAAAMQSSYGTREVVYTIQKTLDGGDYISISFEW